jgi:hypothetical protein
MFPIFGTGSLQCIIDSKRRRRKNKIFWKKGKSKHTILEEGEVYITIE